MTATRTGSPQAVLVELEQGRRLTRDDALLLHREAGLFDLGRAAHRVRLARHPEASVSYVVDRNINYSNVCVCGCTFCAYYRAPGHEEGFVMSKDELARKIEEALRLGATQILLQGGHHPDLDLAFYESMLRFIKSRYPIHVHGFSPPEIAHIASVSGLDTREVIRRLMGAGLDSIPGGGAEILVDRVRSRVSPNKCDAATWLGVMREAHELGLRTTATMMFGHLETDEDRVEHLFALRELQDETGGFTAFIPWSFQQDNTALAAAPETSESYLRMLALARLALDNFDNLQASWVTMGPKIAQLSLFFGANDFGSTMIEENVVAAAGVRFRLSETEIRRQIHRAGFTPRQRRMDYASV